MEGQGGPVDGADGAIQPFLTVMSQLLTQRADRVREPIVRVVRRVGTATGGHPRPM